MMQQKKRFFGVLLAIALLVSAVCVPAAAASQALNEEELITVLNFIEPQKETFGLESVDFSTLRISDVIHSYEYIDGQFQEILGFYLLFSGSTPVALVLSPDGEHYQVMTAFTKQIGDSGFSQAAFIYDAKGCYLYDGTDLLLLGENPESEPVSRSALPDIAELLDAGNIVLTDISLTEPLGYVLQPQTRAQTYYSCGVKYVTQNPYDNLCWAATIACISNCVKGTNLTAVGVGKPYWAAQGQTDFNQGLLDSESAALMRKTYGLDYTYQYAVPSDNVIIENIRSGYPIFATFIQLAMPIQESSDTPLLRTSRHAVTLYGINPFSGYISLMDPLLGAASATLGDSNYLYTSPLAQNPLLFNRAICHSW